MLRYLVCFDIPDDTTRKEVAETLEGYGLRVQRSVFEVVCKSRAEFQKLQHDLLALLDQEADSVRFYPQCENCAAKAFDLGNFPDPFDRDAVYIF